MAATLQGQGINIPAIVKAHMTLVLVGESPLICHRWSEKAKKEMLDKQMKRAKATKEAKDPQADYEASLYPHPDGGYGFPSIAFKAAACIAGYRANVGITAMQARAAFHIAGELVQLIGTPRRREDMVRVGNGVADIRYRGEFPVWRAIVEIDYNPHMLSAEQIVNLFNLAGFGVGVGEWRPEKDGQYGRFHVASEAEF